MKYKHIRERFLDKVELIPFHDCWEWTGQLNKKGYGVIHKGREGTSTQAHRVSYELFIGNIPPDLFVCHSCDNRSCVNPRHLWIGTPRDNTNDMISKGRVATGLRQVGRRKLSIEQVLAIRKEYKAGVVGYGYKAIAKRHNVRPGLVRAIVTRKTWWYLKDDGSTIEEVH